MLQAQKPSPEPETSDLVAEEAGLADTALFAMGVLRQQYRIILPVAVVTAALIASACVAYLWIAPPSYLAKTQLVIERGKSTFLQQQAVLPDAPVDSAQVESEIQILMSGRIAALAVKNLHLTEDPEFVGTGSGLIASAKRRLGDFLRGLDLLKPRDPSKSDSDPVQQAAAVLLSNLQVNRLGISFILEIAYQSHRPERAVQVANAIADAYIFDQMDSKYKMQRRASDWLQTRLNELRQQAVASEQAVNAYKAKNNIVTTGGAPISEQEIAELNKQLVEARTRTSDILARLNRIESVLRCADAGGGRLGDRTGADSCPDKNSSDSYGAVSDLLTNPIVTKLRQQYLELVNRESEYSARYGPDHAAVVNLRNQIRDIQSSILNELRRLADSYKSDFVIAKQRQDAVEKDLARSVAQSQTTNKAQGALRELESNAQSTRSVYEVFLKRYTESLQQQTYVTPEARVLAPAGAALQKTRLKPVVILALSVLGGLGAGFGLAFLRVAMDRVFRTSQQIETALHVPCVALVPLIKTNPKINHATPESADAVDSLRMIFRNGDVFWTVVDSPLSRFAEAIRSIKLAVDLQQVNGLSTVAGFTSSIPNEGKTTIAAALALLMGQVGHRVIVVDCDLRNPSLTRALAPNATTGIIEVLCGEKSVEEVSWHCQVTGLTFLPAVVKPGLLHTSEILASAATKRLFEQLRLSYDYIVVDLPPLAPIIDVRTTGHLVDFYFLVIEWGETKIDVVKHTLGGARPIFEHLLGAVLNKTDIDQMAHYDRHRSQYYHNKHYGRYGYTA